MSAKKSKKKPVTKTAMKRAKQASEPMPMGDLVELAKREAMEASRVCMTRLCTMIANAGAVQPDEAEKLAGAVRTFSDAAATLWDIGRR